MREIESNVLILSEKAPQGVEKDAAQTSLARDLTVAEELEQQASALGAEHQVSRALTRERLLLPRAEENVRRLLAAYQQLVADKRDERAISPLAKYLVDNFGPVEKQLREICVNLKPDYDDKLPKLKNGPLAGLPRIYAVALSLTTHTDNRLDAEKLIRYFRAYQYDSPLSTIELGAVPVMLRLALVENLCHPATRIANARAGQIEAGASSDSMEHGWQAKAELIIGNTLNSLRWLSTFNSRQFFESVSLVDLILRREPSGVYPLMESATRDSYCRAIENIAQKTGWLESDIAQRAVELAAESFASHSKDVRRNHVGYYLIAEGLIALERSIGYHPHWRERVSRGVRRYSTAFYLGLLASLTILILILFALYAAHLGASALALAVLVMLAAAPVSDVVVNALNTTLPFKPTVLPKMDFSRGIPAKAQTMIIVPAMLSSESVVRDLLSTLEAHYLSNQDPHLFFALLSDWSDAEQESLPGDDALLKAVSDGIKELNKRYSDGQRDRFYLFHRRRQWNESEERWIGWERKRGKLREFNRLLRGARDTSYITGARDDEFLAQTRYIITLDSDTLLPRDGARRLVGVISHPLNQPQLDPQTKRVVHGHGIIQPRVTVLPPAAPRNSVPVILTNRFDVNATPPATPNLYQDLFGEGNFVGKGLYDVDAFESALENRSPENSLLSHDLYEGFHTRPALATDIIIFDNPQSHYEAATKRQHRWTRGDWQVLPWLLPRVPTEHGKTERNVLPLIARWKILDTLRRSLIPPAVLLWLIAGWTILPGSAFVWTLFVALTLASTLSFSAAPNFLFGVRQAPQASFTRQVWHIVKLVGKQLYSIVLQLAISFTFIAHHAPLLLDAISRTLYRKLVSGRHLLEWVTAAQVQHESARSPLMFIRYMWTAAIVALACGSLILFSKPAALPVAAVFLAAWIVSPCVAYWLSSRMQRRALGLEQEVERAVRLNGRRMWRSFEHFMGINYESRSSGKSHSQNGYINSQRRSYLNLARLLLWTKAAYEMGSMGVTELVERLQLTFAELRQLQRSLDQKQNSDGARMPGQLAPQYILSAENGNLAGHLPALKQSCLEVIERPLFDERALRGIADTFSLMRKELARIRAIPQTTENNALTQLHKEIEACEALLPAPEQLRESALTISGWLKLFTALERQASAVEAILAATLRKDSPAQIKELFLWNSYVIKQAREFSRDLRTLFPWLSAVPMNLESALGEAGAKPLALWSRIVDKLEHEQVISHLPQAYELTLGKLEELRAHLNTCFSLNENVREQTLTELDVLKSAIEKSLENSKNILALWFHLARQSETVTKIMDFSVLFDEERRFSRGFTERTIRGV
ncbi:MAG: hypothetical protein WCB68_19555 [Pyrinomonadaceae bacterium]